MRGTPLVGLVLSLAATAEPAKAWRTAAWGMTQSQVVAAFSGEAVPLEKPLAYDESLTARVRIPQVTVATVDLRADFIFRGDRLAVIMLYATGGVNISGYEALERKLSEKYGTPLLQQRSRSGAAASWRAPGALVRLVYLESLSQMTVEYRPPGDVDANL